LDRDIGVSDYFADIGDALAEFGDSDIDRILCSRDIVDDPRD